MRCKKERYAAWMATVVMLNAYASEPAAKLPSDDKLKADIAIAEHKWMQAALDYSNCLGTYVEKMFRSLASAGDIADGAAASCGNIAMDYGINKLDEQARSMILYRKGYAPGEMEHEMRTAPTARQLANDLAGENRGASIDYILKLRAKIRP